MIGDIMKRYIVFLSVLLVSCNVAFSQTTIFQAFYNTAEKAKSDQKYEDAIYWYTKAVDKADELNIENDLTVSICYFNIGELYATLGDSLSCMINMEKGVREAERWVNKDDYLFAIILERKAQAMVNVNNPADAIPLFREAIRIFEKCSWKDFARDGYAEPDLEYIFRYSEALYWAGHCYELLNDYDNALKYFELAHSEVSKKVADSDIPSNPQTDISLMAGNINIGIVSCYLELSKSYFQTQEIDKAINYYERAFDVMESCPNIMLCSIGSYQQDVIIRLIENCNDKKKDVKKYIKQYFMVDCRYQKILSDHFNYNESQTALSVFLDLFAMARECKRLEMNDAYQYCISLGLSVFEKDEVSGEDYAYALYTYANWLQDSQSDVKSALQYDKKSIDILLEDKRSNDSLIIEYIVHTTDRYSAYAERPFYQNMDVDIVRYRNYQQLSPVWREILQDLYENLGQTKTDSILYQSELQKSISLGRFEHPFLHCHGIASEYLSEILISIMQRGDKAGNSLIQQLFEELEIENKQYLFPYALTEIAGIYHINGFSVQAKDLLSAAFNLSKQYENMELCEFIALRMCSILFYMGEDEKAVGVLSYWDDDEYLDVNNYIEAQLLLCYFNQSIANYKEASRHAIAALEAYDSNKDKVHHTISRISILTQLGETYAGLKQFDKAQKSYDEAMAAYKENQNNNIPDFSLYTAMGVLAFKKGDYDNAKASFRDLLEKADKWDYPSASWLCSQYLCEISIKQGDYENAERYLNQFWKIESDKVFGLFNAMTEDEREAYWRKSSNMVGFYGVRALQNEPALNSPYYNIVLSNKGQLINTSLSVERNVQSSKNNQLIDLYQAMKLTRNAPDSVKYNIAKQFVMLYNKEFDHNDLIITWQDIQNSLSKNDCAIEFVKCQDGDNDPCFGALILKKGYKKPVMVKLCNYSDLEELYKQGKNMYLPESVLKLYDLIWKPIEHYLHENDNVYFTPDDILHQINIEILYDQKGNRVCEKYNLHRVSSSRQICIKKKNVNYSSMAIYGGLQYEMSDAEMIAQNQKYQTDYNIAVRGFITDSISRFGWKYLLGTKEEVDRISEKMKKSNVDVFEYYGINGTEESFKSLSSKKIQIIHLATHGFFFKNEETKGKAFFDNQEFDGISWANNMLKRSGLVMAGGQRAWLGDSIPINVDDGILLADEIAAMDLSGTDLVVLSACETGLGDITSDGVFGLQRAFKMAGVQTLVMSLWKVDDNATSLMMQTFYEHLLSGKSKHEAFNLAQAVVRNKYPEPYYWAGFIMMD